MPSSSAPALTGGCQCGAVRFRAARLGASGICHCRMCQKAMGNIFAAFVSGYDVTFTRGAPSWFQSSNLAERGFCSRCGTPLFYRELDNSQPLEIAIGALDDPEWAPPTKQVNPTDRLHFFPHLTELPTRPPGAAPEIDAFNARVVSRQHPDHDTVDWPLPPGIAS